MKSSGKPPVATRRRLLEASCEVFAEKGYRDTTIAEICRLAGANLASVNYHFGDKASLYGEVWRHAYALAIAAHPPAGGLSETAPAAEQLRAHVLALLRRVFSRGRTGVFAKLMLREMTEPTAALKDILNEGIRPQRDRMLGIVGKLLGEGASPFQVRLCAMSTVNQCLAFAFNRRVRKHFSGRAELGPKEVERLADHICRFSLAGIREVRRHPEAGSGLSRCSSIGRQRAE